MARFEDFSLKELGVIKEAMAWSQSEIYDPGHTQEEQRIFDDMMNEVKNEIQARDLPWIEPEDQDDAEPAQEAAERPQVTRQDTPATLHTRPVYPPARAPYLPQGRDANAMPTPAPGKRPRQYHGFLYIKCPVCGDIHAFNARTPITTHRCKACGHVTPLTDMTYMKIICECGSQWSYNTNIKDKQFDVPCFNCGPPVAVEYEEDRDRYYPIWIREARRKSDSHRRKKRGGGR